MEAGHRSPVLDTMTEGEASGGNSQALCASHPARKAAKQCDGSLEMKRLGMEPVSRASLL